MKKHVRFPRSYYYDTSRVEGIGLIMLASFLLVIYFLWIGICVRLQNDGFNVLF